MEKISVNLEDEGIITNASRVPNGAASTFFPSKGSSFLLAPYTFDKEKRQPEFEEPQIVNENNPLRFENMTGKPVYWGYHGYKINNDYEIEKSDKKELLNKAMSKGKSFYALIKMLEDIYSRIPF